MENESKIASYIHQWYTLAAQAVKREMVVFR